MEKIAQETEEDYQKLIACLESLEVKVVRPNINFDATDPNLVHHITQTRPPMCPGDDLIMLGNTLIKSFTSGGQSDTHYSNIIKHVELHGNPVEITTIESLCGASVYQLDTQILFTTLESEKDLVHNLKSQINRSASSKNIHCVHQHGHIDGWFTPVTPGLIISTVDSTRPKLWALFFETYFPNWKVVQLLPTLTESLLFQRWLGQHSGTWWVPGQENNREFIAFVDQYFKKWTGDVRETIFELNMIVVDQHNVIVGHYNQQVFDALAQHNVTPHLVKMRHANFWDGGVHCVITELHREN
jgi:hypothetical protein